MHIEQVFGRNEDSLQKLSKEIGCGYATDSEKIFPDADLYLIAVSENAIPEILEKINLHNKLIVHTAGSVPVDILQPYSDHYGVFYPLQTFSKQDDINFREVPFCIEANSPENMEKLVDLAQNISDDVREINSEQRRILHLAAVFACNFPNLLYIIAEHILHENNLDFDILLPLIKQTTLKITKDSPANLQTGPAIRNDMETIHKHLELLEDKPVYKEIYKLLTATVISYQ